ncbi:MAG: hypothetical protein ACK50Z_04740 [Betaproteobacteria bacterium]|jgi:hypothetical protein|nr:hypothetical protein [Betaproteobacteria bacterium]
MQVQPRQPKPEHLRQLLRVVLVLTALVTGGCAAFEKREPMTLDQVVQLSVEGKSADHIINRLSESRTIFALSGSGYARLREQGVDDAVLDFIQRSYVARVELDSRLRYQGWYSPGFYPPYYRPMMGPWPYWYGW